MYINVCIIPYYTYRMYLQMTHEQFFTFHLIIAENVLKSFLKYFKRFFFLIIRVIYDRNSHDTENYTEEN